MKVIRGHKKRNLLVGSSTVMVVCGGLFLWKVATKAPKRK